MPDAASPNARYLVRLAQGKLAPLVECFWYFEGTAAPRLERLLPSCSSQLLVNLDLDRLRWHEGPDAGTPRVMRGAGFSGCQLAPLAIDVAEQTCMVGAKFKPGGAAAFLGVPAGEITNQHVGLDELWPRGQGLRARLLELRSEPARLLQELERFLLGRFDRDAVADAGLDWATQALARGARVSRVVRQLGVTPRRFIAKFEQRAGLKPKAFQRVARFQHALSLAPSQGWAEVAAPPAMPIKLI